MTGASLVALSAAAWLALNGDPRAAITVLADLALSFALFLPLVGLVALAFLRRWGAFTLGLAVQALLVGSTQQWAWPAPAKKPAGPVVRILTYNVQHAWRGPEAIARDVKEADADVVCMQELNWDKEDADAYRTLRRALPEYRFFSSNGRTTASRLPIVWQREVWLTPYSWSWSLVETKVVKDGASLRVLNVHLPSFRTDLVGQRTLAQNVKRVGEFGREQLELIEKIGPLAEGAGDATIVAGDMNRGPQGRAMEPLRRRGRDAWLDGGFGPGWTMPSAAPARRIDQAWTFGPCRCVAASVLNSGASDHAAVLFEVAVADDGLGRAKPRGPNVQTNSANG